MNSIESLSPNADKSLWVGRRLVLVAALILSAASIVWPTLSPALDRGAYYQWEDENGQVNFGDTPPSNAKNIKEHSRNPSPRRYQVEERESLNQEQDKLVDQIDQQGKAEDTAQDIVTAKDLLKKQKELNDARCNSLRNNLKVLDSGARVSVTDPSSGEKSYIGGDEVNRRRATIQAQIQKDCQ